MCQLLDFDDSGLTSRAVRRFMKEYARETPDAGPTELAEQAAWHFNIDQTLDDEAHWIWDVAYLVDEWAEEHVR